MAISLPMGEGFAKAQDKQAAEENEIATEFNRCRIHIIETADDQYFHQDDKRREAKQEDRHSSGSGIDRRILLA